MSLVAAILISVPIWALHRITENRTYDHECPGTEGPVSD